MYTCERCGASKCECCYMCGWSHEQCICEDVFHEDFKERFISEVDNKANQIIVRVHAFRDKQKVDSVKDEIDKILNENDPNKLIKDKYHKLVNDSGEVDYATMIIDVKTLHNTLKLLLTKFK